ncbi:hypothetical protein DXZ20_29175 [Leptolyngbyaceae cyanobacterium CCMR0081]|uniref:Uncharacterized protein n=1 Tax=Adonisia turfae CCMR0081 TaxID=2292702 RepID=A0A6M0RV90_9CYAN|nr:hypothetical protein [Adonisia turfae CCMR0081]
MLFLIGVKTAQVYQKNQVSKPDFVLREGGNAGLNSLFKGPHWSLIRGINPWSTQSKFTIKG